MSQSNEITNIAFYRFIQIEDPAALCSQLKMQCANLGIKGTILIATEGINAMLAGSGESMRKFLKAISGDQLFSQIPIKKTFSESVPFKRLIVKVKKEIITLRQQEINLKSKYAPYVSPHQLKDWLDGQEDFILLDTRNDFEVNAGKFKNAINPEIKSFGQFPKFIQNKLMECKNKKIVTYCTGGIRCEKATAYMLNEGFTDVYQLEGGVLEFFNGLTQLEREKYFQGKLFVFDERVTI